MIFCKTKRWHVRDCRYSLMRSAASRKMCSNTHSFTTVSQDLVSPSHGNPLNFFVATWRGLVSSSWWATHNDGVDFGNSFYNDHHFHYGYFIYTAAVLVHIDMS